MIQLRRDLYTIMETEWNDGFGYGFFFGAVVGFSLGALITLKNV